MTPTRPPLRSVRVVSDSPRVVYPLRDDERRRMEASRREMRALRLMAWGFLLAAAAVAAWGWYTREWRSL